jgi:hypothetical protein
MDFNTYLAGLLTLFVGTINNDGARTQLGVNTFYQSEQVTYKAGQEDKTFNETKMPIDIKLSRRFESGLILGGLYNIGTRTIDDGTDSETQAHKSYGYLIGYDGDRAFLHVTYYLNSSYTVAEDKILTGGTGFQVDWGVKLRTRYFYIVPQISYTSYTFKELDNDGTDFDVDSSALGGISPRIGLMVQF